MAQENTNDRAKAQERDKRFRLAINAIKKDEGVETVRGERRKELRAEHGVTHKGRGGTQYFNEKGKLTDIGEGSNPFKVDSLEDFDGAAFGRGASRGKDWINTMDVARLHKEGGYSAQEMADAFKDRIIKGGAKKWFERNGIDMGGGTVNQPGTDNEGSEGVDNNPTTPEQPAPTVPTPVDQEPPDQTYPGVPGQPGSGVYVGGDLTQNIGKQGDMNTTIGDGNTFGDNTSIGNDYSLTLGSQSVGGGDANNHAAGLLHQQAKQRAKAYMS